MSISFNNIIRKSDGNYIFWNGQQRTQRHPPSEHIESNSLGWDFPPFAHTGEAHEHETGEQGVGHLIKGEYEVGPHGEVIYKDEMGGLHFHGIDAFMHGLGNFLEKSGFKKSGDKELVPSLMQEAITATNAKHGKDNQIPDVLDKAHRRVVISDYQGPGHDTGRASPRKHYVDINGVREFITGYTNYHKNTSRHGTFLDSVSAPYQYDMLKILGQRFGISNANKELDTPATNFLVRPHITRNHMSFGYAPPSEKNPQGAYYRNGNNYPTGHFEQRGKSIASQSFMDGLEDAGMPVQQKLGKVSSYGIAHWLHDDFYRNLSTHGTSTTPYKDKGATRLANQAIMDAMGGEGNMEGLVNRRVKQTMLPSQHPALMNTLLPSGTPLGILLQNEESRKSLLASLSKNPAFMKIFGKTDKNSPAGRMMAASVKHHTGQDVDPENIVEELGLDGYRKHIGTEYDTIGGKTGRNHRAADAYALAIAAGKDENMGDSPGNSKFRSTRIPEELLQQHGLSLVNTSDEELQMTRSVIEAMSEYLADAHGHESRMSFPNELPTEPLVTHHVGGSDATGVPLSPYVRYSPILPTTVADETTQAMNRDAQTTQMVQPPVQPPVQNTIAQPAQNRQLTPEQITAARTSAANMTDEQLRRIAAAGGGNMTTQGNIDRFRSAYGDPDQRMITEYMKSLGDGIEAQDRLIKTMERLQMKDAIVDDNIMKHIPERNFSMTSPNDVSLMAKKLGLTAQDIRLINNSKGDWLRLSKAFGFQERDIKIVKVTFRGNPNE